MSSNAAAYAVDGRSVSREAFYAVACDPARSVVVEACAGAGKTWMLVSRILRALLEGAQPHEILAITFTRKAAGEMRARLDEWLSAFASPSCGDDERVAELRARGLDEPSARRLAPALASLHERVLRCGRSVEVRTFHAWFSQLLRAAPLELLTELGLQPDMELLEDASDHRAQVYRRFHAAVLADASLRRDFDTLVRERGRSQLRKWLDAAWDKRVEIELADQAGTLEDSVPPAASHWPGLAEYAHPAQRLQSASSRTLLSGVAAALGAASEAVCRKQATLLEQALEQVDPVAALAAVRAALFTQKGALRKGLAAPGLVDAASLLDDIDTACAQQRAHEDHLRMVRLARCLLSEFAAYKRARGLADMADLERCAFALLRDSTLAGWVQERLDARVHHLLIDEFQDTSPLQWHALHAWLSGYAGAGGGGSGQRPPAVFIVGDPKQSIYRFRRAEPKVFDAAREFVLRGLGGSALACDHTRRNEPRVLAALNAVFEQAQREGDFSGFRPHTTQVAASDGPGLFALPLVARPAKGEGATLAVSGWRDSLTMPRHEPEELLREAEARRVAATIQCMVDSGRALPGEVQVLCRKRESLRLVADALAARHVPFAAAEDFSLLDAPEARDLMAVLDVLVSPEHKLSLAHALRSPIFGAGDDDLIALARASSPHGDWWRALVELEQASAALQRARELLARWRAASHRLPPHDLLDMVVADGQVRERVAAAVPAHRQAAALSAIDAMLGQALTLDGARYATPYNFVRALKRRVITVPAALQPAAVQLLTVHGAKGLEADVVFVMDSDPEAKAPETATLLVDWPVASAHPLRCAFIYSEAQCPPSLKGIFERELQARQREELNGLYVAMTRARSLLVFSATEPFRRSDRASWWQRVQPGCEPLIELPPSSPREGLPQSGARRVLALPVLNRPPAAPAPPRAAAGDEASRLGQAVHRVLEWAATPEHATVADLESLAASAAREFAVDSRTVARLASRIWCSPSCSAFFRGPLRWAGNEVPVADAGEVLRIDRLVQLDDGGTPAWWVLDYKLQQAPQTLPAYREQLLRYRDAVQRLQPDETVRCAFITGSGELVEVH